MSAAAAAPATIPCARDERPMVREVLYLGRSIPAGGEVTDSAWARFVAEEVTSRFPDGFTVLNGSGQWRDAQGAVARERTFLLVVLHLPSPTSEAAIRAIAGAYRRRFGQEAVLRERAPACVSLGRSPSP